MTTTEENKDEKKKDIKRTKRLEARVTEKEYAKAVELAEKDARERMKRAFCLQICGERGNTESGCECTDFFDFLRYYDNE